MRGIFDPGFKEKSITLVDNVVYSHVQDLAGNPMELKLSVMLQNGNSEMRAAMGEDDPREDHSPKPALIWIPGGGWRGADKNLMLGEMSEYVRAGYVVVSIYYRNSAEGKWPCQLQDVKTAIRFVKENAARFEIDPQRIGVFGRSAGGHLAAFAGQNLAGFDTEEWNKQDSTVQAAIDFFGPVDVEANMLSEIPRLSDPNYRWHRVEDTHGGALIGGDPETIPERSKAATLNYYVNDGMAPLMMLHGDNDPLVPVELSSERLYNKLCEMGLEDRCEFYVIPHAGHGSREFFQPATKKLTIAFFDKYLK